MHRLSFAANSDFEKIVKVLEFREQQEVAFRLQLLSLWKLTGAANSDFATIVKVIRLRKRARELIWGLSVWHVENC